METQQSQEFTTTRVEIPVGDETIVGLLRLPAGPGPFAAVVVLGPLTSVKEQVPGHYADALARRGIAALAIDNRHFGESSGAPRHYEHPGRKVEDAAAALTWLSGHPQIDGERLGALGVCAGAGYLSGLVTADRRVAAFAAVAGFFHDAQKQRQWMGERYDGVLARARAARERYEATGESEEIPAVGDSGEEVAMPLAEAFTYYGTPRGAHPNYVNRFAVMSREYTLPWDAQGNAARITAPTLMIHSENALAPALARSFFAALAGPKEEVWTTSSGQIDFYDDPARIEPAADHLAAHFHRHLGGPRAAS